MKNSMRNLAAGLALVLTAAVSITVGSQVGLRIARRDAQAAAVVPAAGTGASAPAEKPEAAPVDANVTAGEDGKVTATGAGQGIGGSVVVQVTADENTIYEVTVTEQSETEGIGTVAVEKLPPMIVSANSLLVDSIASATVTSDAIKEGVRAALTAAGFDPANYENEVAAEEIERTPETLDCDVVIVGAGGAGMTAAITAAQNGAKVVLLEKMPFVGGNSLKASGGMNAAGTATQAAAVEELKDSDPKKAERIADSTVENFITDTMEGGRWNGELVNDIDLVTTMAENSAAGIEWLASIGAPLPGITSTGGTSHSYLHEPENGEPVGEFLVPILRDKCSELGVTLLLDTPATDLIMQDGTAVGVHAQSREHDYTVNAKAVILATGGFGANYEMMTQYDESLAKAVTTNTPAATGDGINMAVDVGADTVGMEMIQEHPTVYQVDGRLVSERVRSEGGILVNAEGKRFTNDMATRKAVSDAEKEQPGAYAYIIFDQRIVDDNAMVQDEYINGGMTVSGSTYEELANAMGLEGDAVQNFVQTMEIWNEKFPAVKEGTEEDEFGRNNGLEGDLSQAPFYAIKVAPGIHHTMGGLKIDTETEVIDTDGNAIPGLFAAGEVTGGVHGGNRIGGNAVCDFVVFGRIAGNNASAFAGFTPAE